MERVYNDNQNLSQTLQHEFVFDLLSSHTGVEQSAGFTAKRFNKRKHFIELVFSKCGSKSSQAHHTAATNLLRKQSVSNTSFILDRYLSQTNLVQIQKLKASAQAIFGGA